MAEVSHPHFFELFYWVQQCSPLQKKRKSNHVLYFSNTFVFCLPQTFSRFRLRLPLTFSLWLSFYVFSVGVTYTKAFLHLCIVFILWCGLFLLCIAHIHDLGTLSIATSLKKCSFSSTHSQTGLNPKHRAFPSFAFFKLEEQEQEGIHFQGCQWETRGYQFGCH